MRLAFLRANNQNGSSHPLPSWRRMILAFIFILSLLVVSSLYLNRAQIIAEFHSLAVAKGFIPKIIEINGRSQAKTEAITTIVEPYRGQSIFTINLDELRRQIIAIGWVEDAIITRILPNRLEINLIERQPIALLQTKAGHQLIDAKGVVIEQADVAAYSHLVVASGKGAAAKAKHILNILQSEPEIFTDVWAVQHISERRWDVYLRSGMTIKLPEQDPIIAWSRFAKLEQETHITRRDLAAIDLRIPGQLIVEPNIPIRNKGRKT